MLRRRYALLAGREEAVLGDVDVERAAVRRLEEACVRELAFKGDIPGIIKASW